MCTLIFSFKFYFEVIPQERWEEIMKKNGWNPVDLRDTRYNQILHMVSAANGAEAFYSTEVSYNFSLF